MGQLEILSPAGSIEGLKAAINANCDALYIGGASFGARAYANNLQEEDMLRAIDYAHVHGKSLYLTINTLLKEHELKEQLYEYLRQYDTQGIDAVIVQDLGVLHFVHENFPNLPIHASTQMSLTMAQGANELKKYGVNRLVTARELSLKEIRAIREETDLEIESFVHGALCFCYSGQCLMSSMIGGRSGNRGRCAQPCRMPYKVKEQHQIVSSMDQSYALSPKDICTVNLIPEMVEAGINSFKIEGRMKRPEYAAGVTYVYRKYLDYFLTYGKDKFKEAVDERNKEYQKDMQMIKDLYNRGGFSNGYYEMHNGKKMMSMDRPNHSGILVGKVKSVSGITATIELTEDVNAKDILEFREANQSLYEFTKKDASKKGSIITANFLKGSKIQPGNLVYRTKNNGLLEQLQERFLSSECKEKIQGYVVAMLGQPLSMTLVCKEHHVTVQSDDVEAAKNQPTLPEKIEKQMRKINDTPFEFEHLEITADDNIFIPVGKLNELRRSATKQLTLAIATSYRREHPVPTLEKQKEGLVGEDVRVSKHPMDRPDITVCVHEKEQIPVVCEHDSVDCIYIDLNCIQCSEISEVTSRIKEKGKRVYLLLPHIFRKETNDLLERYQEELCCETVDGYVLRNLEEYAFLQRMLEKCSMYDKKELILDYNVYVMNNEAKAFWREKGVHHYTTSLELNYHEMKHLGCEHSDILVYGRVPLMVSAQCFSKNIGDHCERMQQKVANGVTKELHQDGKHVYELFDRFNKSFYVRNHCKFCYNTIYNGDCLSLLSNKEEVLSLRPRAIRIDFTFETKDQIHTVLESYIHGYRFEDWDVTNIKEGKHLTRGHFKRGIQ